MESNWLQLWLSHSLNWTFRSRDQKRKIIHSAWTRYSLERVENQSTSWTRSLFRTFGCVLMKFKYGRKPFAGSFNRKILNGFYSALIAGHNDQRCQRYRHGFRVSRAEQKIDTNVVMMEWNKMTLASIALENGTSEMHIHFRIPRSVNGKCAKIENERKWHSFFLLKTENCSNVKPVTRDWMQKVVGFYFRRCGVQGENGATRYGRKCKNWHPLILTHAIDYVEHIVNALKTIQLWQCNAMAELS